VFCCIPARSQAQVSRLGPRPRYPGSVSRLASLRQMSELTVASFNVHGGVDGWGRRIPVVECAANLDADVLVLQEVFAPDGGESTADEIAALTGMKVAADLVLARAQITPGDPPTSKQWRPLPVVGPPPAMVVHRFEMDRPTEKLRRKRPEPVGRGTRRGTWSLAVLSRLPVVDVSVLDLGRLPSDKAKRLLAVVDVDVGERSLTVVGAHMSHLSSGSPVQFSKLRRELTELGRPAVLVGDMNLWGPPTCALLPGWARAVKGLTWPAWRPIAQPDHILVRPPVEVIRGEVVRNGGGSDHLPVRATLRIDQNEATLRIDQNDQKRSQ